MMTVLAYVIAVVVAVWFYNKDNDHLKKYL